MPKTLHEKWLKSVPVRVEKTALLSKSCIKEDVSNQGEIELDLVGLCEIRFVESHVSIPEK